LSSQAVDLVLPVPWGKDEDEMTAAEQSAWLQSTRVPLRTISSEEDECMMGWYSLGTLQSLTASENTLAASHKTLEVLSVVMGFRALAITQGCAMSALHSMHRGTTVVIFCRILPRW